MTTHERVGGSWFRRRVATIGVAGAALAVVAAGGLMIAATQPEKKSAQAIGSLDLYTVSQLGFSVTCTASGELEAKNQIEIRNKLEMPTKIVELAKEGSVARKGDLLVKLTSEDIETDLEEEEGRVATARAEVTATENAVKIQLNENESNERQSDVKLKVAELDLLQWREGDLKTRRQKLEVDLNTARRELTRLSEKFERAKELKTRGFLSEDELKSDEINMLRAEGAFNTAELALRVFNDYEVVKEETTRLSDVREATSELERVKDKNASLLASKQAELENKKRQFVVRENRLAKLREQLAATTIIAPADGLVVYGTSIDRMRFGSDESLQVGRDVRPNELLIILPDTSEMVAGVRVPEALAGRVREGQKATVKIDALGGSALAGTVSRIGVLAESGGWRDPNLREYAVKVTLDSQGEQMELKPGMRCEAEIVLEDVTSTLAVPVQSVFYDGFLSYVYTPQGKRFVKRPVAVGRRSDRYAEIRAGLGAGERVLVREPATSEVLDVPFSDEQLLAAGFSRGEDGQVVPIARPGAAPGRNGARTVAIEDAPANQGNQARADGDGAGRGGPPRGDGQGRGRGRQDGGRQRGGQPGSPTAQAPEQKPGEGGSEAAAPVAEKPGEPKSAVETQASAGKTPAPEGTPQPADSTGGQPGEAQKKDR